MLTDQQKQDMQEALEREIAFYRSGNGVWLVKAMPVKYLEETGHEKKKQSRKTIHDAR